MFALVAALLLVSSDLTRDQLIDTFPSLRADIQVYAQSVEYEERWGLSSRQACRWADAVNANVSAVQRDLDRGSVRGPGDSRHSLTRSERDSLMDIKADLQLILDRYERRCR